MNECKCTICGKMKLAPLDILANLHFVCSECKDKEAENENRNVGSQQRRNGYGCFHF